MIKRLFPILLVALFAPIAAQAAPSQEYWGSVPMKISGQPSNCILKITRTGRGIGGLVIPMTGTKVLAVLPFVGFLDGKDKYHVTTLKTTSGVIAEFSGRLVEKKYISVNGAIRFPAPKKQSCDFGGKASYIGGDKLLK